MSTGKFQALFTQVSESADMLLFAGDLTDTGQPEEARILARELSSLRVPGVAVLGNHDFESGHQEEVSHILTDSGLTMLDGEACEVHGIGIAGVKGFAGGFGTAALGPWGEPTIKQFVHEAVNEALKLEASLARLRSARQVVLLHYSPVRQTVEGEPLEIYPFVGSSRLEEPITASRFRWSCTDTRIAVATRAVPRTTCRSKTSRCPCSAGRFRAATVSGARGLGRCVTHAGRRGR